MRTSVGFDLFGDASQVGNKLGKLFPVFGGHADKFEAAFFPPNPTDRGHIDANWNFLTGERQAKAQIHSFFETNLAE